MAGSFQDIPYKYRQGIMIVFAFFYDRSQIQIGTHDKIKKREYVERASCDDTSLLPLRENSDKDHFFGSGEFFIKNKTSCNSYSSIE